MEKIWQAVERARATPGASKPQGYAQAPSIFGSQVEAVEIDPLFLLSKRIVSASASEQARSYDMLRTQVLRAMEQHGWKTLGVSSPTPACGKTLTAINLAFSIARQENQSIVLADLDLRKPQIAAYLGLRCPDRGVLDVLEEKISPQRATISVCAAEHQIAVLPTAGTKESSERMTSRAMRNLLQDLKKAYQTVVLDLPPMLSSDDVISILPQVDCVLLVVAVGRSKTSEVEEAMRYLESTPLVRLVLNKADEEAAKYYY